MSVEQMLSQDFGTLAEVIGEQAKERAGKPALLFVGFKQDTQFDIDRWMIALTMLKAFYRIGCL